jgi:hypothetical protein
LRGARNLSAKSIPTQKEGDVENPQSNPPPACTTFTIQNAAILTKTFDLRLALLAYFTQACYMKQAMRLDQRAWVGVSNPVTENNVLDAKHRTISFGKVSVILRKSGKTPALPDWDHWFAVAICPICIGKDDLPGYFYRHPT